MPSDSGRRLGSYRRPDRLNALSVYDLVVSGRTYMQAVLLGFAKLPAVASDWQVGHLSFVSLDSESAHRQCFPALILRLLLKSWFAV